MSVRKRPHRNGMLGGGADGNRAPVGARRPASNSQGNGSAVGHAVALSLVDYSLILSLVFGGCCANVWSYEQLLKMDAHIGTTLTFSQMLFITAHSLPSFLVLPKGSLVPKLKPRHVPLRDWAVQVLVLTSGSLLNNWVYAFSVPLTVQIVFRSAGLAVSMMLGYLVLKKRYSLPQVAAVALVSAGVVLATLSRPSTPKSSASPTDVGRYTIGVIMLTVSLLFTGILGVLQERTYTRYGPHWKEGVFYTHGLSLPIFLFFIPDLKRGFGGLSDPTRLSQESVKALGGFYNVVPYAIFGANLLTQLACASGVNQLTSHVSSVSTNLVLTTRKAISLCFSVWWFGNGLNAQLAVGAGMVFLGSLLYTFVSSRPRAASSPSPAKTNGEGKAVGAGGVTAVTGAAGAGNGTTSGRRKAGKTRTRSKVD